MMEGLFHIMGVIFLSMCSGAAGPSEASKAVVPDQYICSITAEIMTDPVNTVRLVPSCPR